MANYTSPENLTRVAEFLRWENSIVGYMLGNVIVFLVFIIFFVGMKNFPTKSAFAASSFISLLVAVILMALGMVHFLVVLATILATAISAVALAMESRS